MLAPLGMVLCEQLQCVVQVARMLKLSGSAVEPLNFIVPRKSDQFQPDLYPPCPAPVPALEAAEWVAGRAIFS